MVIFNTNYYIKWQNILFIRFFKYVYVQIGLNNIREEKNYPFTSPFFLDNKNGNNLNKNNELIFNADFESGKYQKITTSSH